VKLEEDRKAEEQRRERAAEMETLSQTVAASMASALGLRLPAPGSGDSVTSSVLGAMSPSAKAAATVNVGQPGGAQLGIVSPSLAQPGWAAGTPAVSPALPVQTTVTSHGSILEAVRAAVRGELASVATASSPPFVKKAKRKKKKQSSSSSSSSSSGRRRRAKKKAKRRSTSSSTLPMVCTAKKKKKNKNRKKPSSSSSSSSNEEPNRGGGDTTADEKKKAADAAEAARKVADQATIRESCMQQLMAKLLEDDVDRDRMPEWDPKQNEGLGELLDWIADNTNVKICNAALNELQCSRNQPNKRRKVRDLWEKILAS